MILSCRFLEALTFATQLHKNQVRKGSGVPYVAHLLGVTSIALEYGANEDEAICQGLASRYAKGTLRERCPPPRRRRRPRRRPHARRNSPPLRRYRHPMRI